MKNILIVFFKLSTVIALISTTVFASAPDAHTPFTVTNKKETTLTSHTSSKKQSQRPLYFTTPKGVGLKGYDPVSFFHGTPQKGKTTIKAQDETTKVSYCFTSDTSKEEFARAPKKFNPQHGAWCTYAMTMGKQITTDPKYYKIIDGKIYFFSSKRYREKWDKAAQKQGEETLLEAAGKSWQKLKKSYES